MTPDKSRRTLLKDCSTSAAVLASLGSRAFFTRGKGIVPTRAKEIVSRSAERYLRAIRG